MKPISRRIHKERVVHYAEGAFSLRRSKMTTGVIRYGIHDSVAVIDSTQVGKTAQEVLGFGGEVPVVGTLEDAMHYHPQAFLIGITPPGGRLTPEVRRAVLAAIDRELDIWTGLHDFLSRDAEIVEAATAHGVGIWDLRRPAADLPVGTAQCRDMRNYITLAVGTDAAIGKMTVMLEVDRLMKVRGIKSEFVATGQVGIAIAGWGSPVDAIAGDFMAGAVERDVLLCEEADVILVEGQGSLYNPGFSSVTLGLLHGSCPDSLILCHQLSRTAIQIASGIPIPPLDQVAEMYLQNLRFLKPDARVVAVSLNTAGESEETARRAIADAEALLGVPATDPIRHGAEKIVDALETHRREIGK